MSIQSAEKMALDTSIPVLDFCHRLDMLLRTAVADFWQTVWQNRKK